MGDVSRHGSAPGQLSTLQTVDCINNSNGRSSTSSGRKAVTPRPSPIPWGRGAPLNTYSFQEENMCNGVIHRNTQGGPGRAGAAVTATNSDCSLQSTRTADTSLPSMRSRPCSYPEQLTPRPLLKSISSSNFSSSYSQQRQTRPPCWRLSSSSTARPVILAPPEPYGSHPSIARSNIGCVCQCQCEANRNKSSEAAKALNLDKVVVGFISRNEIRKRAFLQRSIFSIRDCSGGISAGGAIRMSYHEMRNIGYRK
ncbi:uncharacterized protein [Anabrus simplex]|uniref:uncharacterized protein n=1 Tax=Anabrus simplex TaxID=316456 RepID=UPI0035A3B6E7